MTPSHPMTEAVSFGKLQFLFALRLLQSEAAIIEKIVAAIEAGVGKI